MNIKGNGFKIYRKEMENKSFLMEIILKEGLLMEKKMVTENMYGIEVHLKVIVVTFRRIISTNLVI